MDPAPTPTHLLAEPDLEASGVVANTAMNRERGLRGVNSYEKELGVDPSDVIKDLLQRRGESGPPVTWLDLCCGRGKAMIEGARLFSDAASTGRLEVVGLDLVDYFDPNLRSTPGVSVVVDSISGWNPQRTFDLITCVHGLHYVGDKLDALACVAGWLTPAGRFVASFDLAGFRWADSSLASRSIGTALRAQGFEVDTRRHRISMTGGRHVVLPFEYLGADPTDGPNYTGQPAVVLYYERPGT